MIIEHQRVLVYRAGSIPYIVENGQIQMLFMRPSFHEFGTFTYQIPKGKVEEDDQNQSSEAHIRFCVTRSRSTHSYNCACASV